MNSQRIQKGQNISRKLIGEYLSQFHQELSTEFGIITVTQVIISTELSYMDVYVSSLKNEEYLTKSLAEVASDIQRILAKKIDFLKVPKLRFRYDESGKNSFEIYSKIQTLEHE